MHSSRVSSTGDLADHWFRWYLTQDMLYLGEYSRVLARASALAPDPRNKCSGQNELRPQSRSKRSCTAPSSATRRIRAASTTLAYTNHLHASASCGSYGELVTALTPCFWLYSDLGIRLKAMNHTEHPYRNWIAQYADPAFAHSTHIAVRIADKAASQASPAERERMQTAFTRSMQHELEFFTAPLHGSNHITSDQLGSPSCISGVTPKPALGTCGGSRGWHAGRDDALRGGSRPSGFG